MCWREGFNPFWRIRYEDESENDLNANKSGNEYDEANLKSVDYGELKNSCIGKNNCRVEEQPITTTDELKEVLRNFYQRIRIKF
jgi:16S rRNA C1402 N4-methylase RsmH